MEVFLVMNGKEINASVDDQEALILSLVSGKTTREELLDWLQGHVHDLDAVEK